VDLLLRDKLLYGRKDVVAVVEMQDDDIGEFCFDVLHVWSPLQAPGESAQNKRTRGGCAQ
jgi:hypothetical protein